MSEWTFCANENQRCGFPGQREVRYGKGSTWTSPRLFTDGVDCTNAVWGDPLFGTIKECQSRPYVAPVPVAVPVPAPVPVPATPPPPPPVPVPLPGTIPQQQPQGFQLSQTTLLLIAGGVLLLMFGSGKR